MGIRDYFHWGDNYTHALRDLDGSLTGVANTELRPINPMNDDPECSTGDELDGYISVSLCENHETGHIRLLPSKTRVDLSTGAILEGQNANTLSFTVQKNSEAPLLQHSKPEGPIYNKFSMNLNRDDQYHIQGIHWNKESEKYIDIIFSSIIMGQVSPVISVELGNTNDMDNGFDGCKLMKLTGGTPVEVLTEREGRMFFQLSTYLKGGNTFGHYRLDCSN